MPCELWQGKQYKEKQLAFVCTMLLPPSNAHLTVWLLLGDTGTRRRCSAASSHPSLLLTTSHHPEWLEEKNKKHLWLYHCHRFSLCNILHSVLSILVVLNYSWKGLFHKAAQEQVKLILNYSSGLLRSCVTGIFLALTNTKIIMCASYSIQEVVTSMTTFLHTQGYFKHGTAKVALATVTHIGRVFTVSLQVVKNQYHRKRSPRGWCFITLTLKV